MRAWKCAEMMNFECDRDDITEVYNKHPLELKDEEERSKMTNKYGD